MPKINYSRLVDKQINILQEAECETVINFHMQRRRQSYSVEAVAGRLIRFINNFMHDTFIIIKNKLFS